MIELTVVELVNHQTWTEERSLLTTEVSKEYSAGSHIQIGKDRFEIKESVDVFDADGKRIAMKLSCVK